MVFLFGSVYMLQLLIYSFVSLPLSFASPGHDAVLAHGVLPCKPVFQAAVQTARERTANAKARRWRSSMGALVAPASRCQDHSAFQGLWFACPLAGVDQEFQADAGVFVGMDFGQPRRGGKDADAEFFFP